MWRRNGHAGASLGSQTADYSTYHRDSWVAFTARYHAEDASGAYNGLFRRASNGSRRLDVTEGPLVYSYIMNVSKALYWRCVGAGCTEGHWTQQPMILPPGGYRPGRIVPRETREVWSGPWRTIEVGDGRGLLEYQSPDLDYFALRTIRPGLGETSFDEVVLGEPDPSVFELPPGVRGPVTHGCRRPTHPSAGPLCAPNSWAS